MSLPPYLAAYYGGNLAFTNQNADFSSYPIAIGAAGYPSGWSGWAGAVPTRAAIGASTAADVVGGAGADGGILIGGAMPISFPAWVVLEARVQLRAGALTGAGVQLNAEDVSTTFTEAVQLRFAVDPDINGVVQGAGTVGVTYQYRKVAALSNPADVYYTLYAMAHYSGLGATTTANEIAFDRVGWRPAFPAEIAAANQVQGLPVFPLLPGVSPDVEKAPTWSTKVKRAASGLERRTAQWPYPIWAFNLNYEVLRDRGTLDEVKGIWELFNTVQGQYAPWLFLDEGGFAVSGAAFGVGDGVTSTFQLTRPVRSWSEPVLAPFAVSVLVNGVATAVTLGPAGLVTFASPPASGAVLTWSGYFFYVCRFAEDGLTLKRIAHQLWSSEGLKFNSVRNL